MTERPDLYAVLGVSPSATQPEISRAYRALIRRHHPDTRASNDQSQRAVSDAALQQVLAAYAVLRDPVRRAAYDRETKPPAQPERRRPQQAMNLRSTYGQPPIIAGPVRRHRAADPPPA